MSKPDNDMLFDFPCFQLVVEFLDVRSALRLRSASRRSWRACSAAELVSWRQERLLPALQKVRGPPPRRQLRGAWFKAPLMKDSQTCWLFDNAGEYVKEVDFRDAPFLTDVTLRKVAAECHSLRSFSVQRNQDNLRIYFHEELRGLTTEGAEVLVAGCARLEHLCLSWCESINGDQLCQAIHESPLTGCLQYLNLNGVPTSNVAVQALSACAHLRDLRLRDTCATDLAPLAACTRMDTLHVCRGFHVQGTGVVAACRGFGDNIRVLCCGGCRQLDEASALEVLELCPRLEVWNCLRGTGIGNQSAVRVAAERGRGGESEVRLDDVNICR